MKNFKTFLEFTGHAYGLYNRGPHNLKTQTIKLPPIYDPSEREIVVGYTIEDPERFLRNKRSRMSLDPANQPRVNVEWVRFIDSEEYITDDLSDKINDWIEEKIYEIESH